ncbi:MAG: hypothetical protein AB8H79_05820 [Myxococcota bacterium]
MIWLIAATAFADPIAQRSPVAGDVAVVVGAPHQAVAWRREGKDGVRLTLSAAIRVPSAATDLSIGLSTRRGPDKGWGWATGVSTGLIATRGPSVALSAAPWIRIERRGNVHGGAQLAIPLAAELTDRIRTPVVGETFIGSQRGRVSVVALGGAGWAWTTKTVAGSLVVHGTVQLGIRLGK